MEPLVPLTLSLVRSPGRYALLLGSGISRSAGIPTGWAVVERLLTDAAAAAGAGTPPDLHVWFRENYGADAQYSDVLRDLGPTPADRQRLIRTYIEPADAERPQPTAAHRAIAELIKDGAIRIIITTNFDDLLERALTAAGVSYHVVASPDAIEGAPPFSHGGVFIFKIHGDYRDERLLNTVDELNAYDPRVTQLLDRLFDEFGLIVCGWSGEWDAALRGAIERVRGRRFATYWMTVTDPTDAAQAIIAQRDAAIIPIQNADRAFADLIDRVAAVRDAQVGTTGDETIAAAVIKRYLADPNLTIRLHDALFGEVDRLREFFQTATLATDTPAAVDERFAHYEVATQTLRAMLTVLGYWATDEHAAYVYEIVTTLLQDRPLAGYVPLINATVYPAVLAANAFALGAFAGRRYTRVARLMDAEFDYSYNGRAMRENGWELLVPTYALAPPTKSNEHGWWWSDHLGKVLASSYKALVLPDDVVATLDRFEHFVAFRATLFVPDRATFHAAGRGAYRKRNTAALLREAERDGATWPGFAAGMPAIEALREHARHYDKEGPPKYPGAFSLNLGFA